MRLTNIPIHSHRREYDMALPYIGEVVARAGKLAKETTKDKQDLRELVLECLDVCVYARNKEVLGVLVTQVQKIFGREIELDQYVELLPLSEEQWEGVQAGKRALRLAGKIGRGDDGLVLAENAIAYYPEHWRGYEAKAQILKQMERYEDALVTWKLALATDAPQDQIERFIKSIAEVQQLRATA